MSSSFDSSSLSSGAECIEEIQKVKMENNQLKQTNNQLLEELKTLRSQCKEMSETNKDYENIQKEIAQLREDNQKLTNENESFSKKLKLDEELINDLRENQIKEKEVIQPINRKSHKNQNEEKSSSSESNHHEVNSQLNNALSENKRLIEELEERNEQNNDLLETINYIMQECQIYFNEKFHDSNQFIEYLQALNQNLDDNNINNNDKDDNKKKEIKNAKDNTKKLIAENKKLKLRLKKELESKKNFEYANEILQNKVNSEKSKNEKIINNLENKIKILKQQSDMQELKYSQENEKKNSKLSTLENENQLLKQQISGMNYSLFGLPSSLNYAVPENPSKESFNILQQKLTETSQSNQRLQDENNTLNTTIINLKKQNDQLFSNLENKTNEITQLRIERDDFEGKYNYTISQMETYKSKVIKLQTSYENVSKNYKKSEQTANALKRLSELRETDIAQIVSGRNTLVNMISKLKDIIQKEENLIDQLMTENKKMKKKYKKVKNACQPSSNNQSSNTDDIIPVTSWYCQEFDEELTKRISEYASNQAFSGSVKLKYVLNTIAKYYNEKIEKFSDNSKKEKENYDKNISIINEVLIPIGKQAGIDNFDSNSIQNPLIISQFQQNISSAINECMKLRQETSHYNSILSELSTILKVSFENLPEEVKAVNSDFEALQEDYNSIKSKYETSKKSINSNKKSLEQSKDKYTQTLKQKDSQIEQLKQKIATLNKKLKENEKNNQNIKLTQSHSKEGPTENKSSIDFEFYQSQITELQNQITQNKSKTDKRKITITKLTNELKEKDKEIKKLEDDVNFWKQNIEAIKVSHIQQNTEIKKLHENYNKLQDETRQQNETDKETLMKQYESVIQSLKSKNIELREMIEKSSTSSSKYETVISKLKAENSHLKREREQMSAKLNVQREEQERQKLLNDQKMKAFELSNDNRVQNEIADLKSKHNAEKKKVMGYAVKQFHDFYDGKKKIDESSYKETLSKASNELKKLIQQDISVRRLLGITNNESIEQAVSTLLMSLYK